MTEKKTIQVLEVPGDFQNWSEEKKAVYQYGYAMAKDRMTYLLKEELIKRDWTNGDMSAKFPMNLAADIFKENNEDYAYDECPDFSIKRLRTAIDELSQSGQYMIRMHYYYGMPVNQIAGDLQVSSEMAESLLHSALQELKEKKNDILSVPLKDYLETCEGNSGYFEENQDLMNIIRKALMDTAGRREWINDIDLSTFNLGVRTYNSLKNAGYNTLGDLKRIESPEELKTIRNLGSKGQKQIEELMKDFGIPFATEKDKPDE